MTKCIQTVCTADYYQWYIPLFVYSIKRIDPEIQIEIFVRGKVDNGIFDLMHKGGVSCCIVEDYKTDYPHNISTTNALRFTDASNTKGYDYVIITDVDFLFFPVHPFLFSWHINGAKLFDWCYYGYHGPWKKGCTFEGGWNGEHERVAGGSFMFTPKWLETTLNPRLLYSKYLKDGSMGLYREEDEVILCRILKDSGLTIPQNKHFPTDLRGIHLGDFKFEYRWTNMANMINKISNNTCVKFRAMQKEKSWQDMIKDIKEPTILQHLQNLEIYLAKRGI